MIGHRRQTDGSYSLDGLFMKVFPLYGDGPFKIELFDLTMMGAGSIAVDDTRHLQVGPSFAYLPKKN